MLVRVKEKLIELIQTTTAHGIPNIIRTKRKFLKFLWASFVIIFSTMCVILIVQNIVQYYEFPVTTKVDYPFVNHVNFPSVAVCNSNPFVTQFAIEEIFSQLGTEAHLQLKENKTKLDILNEMLIQNNSLRNQILTNAYSLNETFKKMANFPFKDVLISCKFEGVECSWENFDWFWSYNYGNCYVFNSININASSLEIRSAGFTNSLTLELFGGFEDLMPIFDVSQGFVVMVYERRQNTDFSDNFKLIMARIGTETNVAINRLLVRKLPKPYSGCDFDSSTSTINSFDSPLYKKIIRSNKTYMRKNCYVLCFEQWSFEKCGCSSISPVKCLTDSQIKCNQEVYEIDYIQNSFYGKCNHLCPLECDSDIYQLASTYKNFPAVYYANFLLQNKSIFQYSPYERPLTVNDVGNSVARVVIYFEKLTYQYIVQIPTISVVNLFANSGGMLGLFMGMSILTFIEVLEAFYEIFLILIHRK